jgi:hypothetical protein
MLSAALIAIQLIHPNMMETTATRYANAIEQQAIVSGVDPLAFIAIIQHESKFIPNAVSADLRDFGLMQVRASNYSGKKEWLLNPEHNIKVGGYIIKASVDLCTKHLHRAPEMAEWAACYSGQCGNPQTYCTPTTISRTVASYFDCLSSVVIGIGNIDACKEIYR